MSYIETRGKTTEEIIREQYPYVDDFRFERIDGKLIIKTSMTGIAESLQRLMRYIAPDTPYSLEEL